MRTSTDEIMPIIQALLWFLTYVVFELVDHSHYLIEWVSYHKVFYIILALIAISITFFSKRIGYFMTFGNLCGLLLGRWLGDDWRYQSMLKITEDMSAQLKYELSRHDGVKIWIGCMLAFLLIAGMIECIKKMMKICFKVQASMRH